MKEIIVLRPNLKVQLKIAISDKNSERACQKDHIISKSPMYIFFFMYFMLSRALHDSINTRKLKYMLKQAYRLP